MNIKELQKKYQLEKDDFWHHQQSNQWIITHNAVEKIANIEGVELIDIKVLNSEIDFLRFLVTMKLADKTISSIGEAAQSNCFSKYKGAMAEKRGIDRCVLKLINAYEYGISSEVEADDFAKPTYYQKNDSHLEKFDSLLQDSYFDGKRKDVKDQWLKVKTLSQTELFLKQMQSRIENQEKENNENQ